MQRQPLRVEAFGELRKQRLGKSKLLVHAASKLVERAAHERASAAVVATVDHLGEHRLVDLDHGGAQRVQLVELLAQHAHNVGGHLLATVVRPVRDALHPHRAGQKVGPRQAHLHRCIRDGLEESDLVRHKRFIAPQRSEDRGVAHLAGGHVQSAQFALELLRVLHVRQQVRNGDELAVLQPACDEARVVIAAHLPVGDGVHARALLCGEHQLHRIIRCGLEFFFRQPAGEVFVDRVKQPRLARPRPHGHDRKRRELRRGGRCRELGRHRRGNHFLGDRHLRALALLLGALLRCGLLRGRCFRGCFRKRPLAHQKAPAGLVGFLDHVDQLVAGESAPRGQVDWHRRLIGDDLQQLAFIQRVDVLANQ